MKIIVQLQNLADNFDKSSKSVYININKFANNLYKDVNGKNAHHIKI